MGFDIMHINGRVRILCYLLLASTFIVQNVQAIQFPSFLDCSQILASGSGSWAGTLSTLTNFQGMLQLTVLIVSVMLAILSLAYALGTAFQIESLRNFAKTEMLEQMFNVSVIAVIAIGIVSIDPFVSFFVNLGLGGISSTAGFASLPAGGYTSSPAIFLDICNAINNNIVTTSFENWMSLVLSLFWVNLFSSFVVSFMPNSFGFSFNPFGGLSLMIQLIWDDQSAYFLSMFFGIFLIVLIFLIKFLFPLFLYLGLALRSFPWTRAAGGSLMALFISFYIIFPGLLYPFIYSSSIAGVTGLGLCNGSAYSSGSQSTFCTTPSFFSSAFTAIVNGFHESFAIAYYDDITAFVNGMIQVGLSVMGLIVALLIAYECTEKIGSLLGSPSISAQRMLSRIL